MTLAGSGLAIMGLSLWHLYQGGTAPPPLALTGAIMAFFGTGILVDMAQDYCVLEADRREREAKETKVEIIRP